MARIEIRISDIEKLNLDNLKQQLGVTTSELFREFLNSYDIGSRKEKLKELEEEKKKIRKELFRPRVVFLRETDHLNLYYNKINVFKKS